MKDHKSGYPKNGAAARTSGRLFSHNHGLTILLVVDVTSESS